jgi:hypothetical protein
MKDTAPQGDITIINVDGLGPPKASIATLGGPGFDGVRIGSKKVTARSIVMTLAITGQGEVEETNRLSLYKFFPIKEEIQFRVITDTRDATAVVHCESNEVKMFGRIENTVITLFGDFPYFIEEVEAIPMRGITPMFSFPFSNGSLTEPLIVFGNITKYVTSTIVYPGDSPTGVIFTITGTNMEGMLNITNVTRGDSLRVDLSVVEDILGSPFTKGDTMVVDTRKGEKSAYVIRDGIIYNIFNALDLFTKWLQLYSGTNEIVIFTDNNSYTFKVNMKYSILYEGM